MVKKISKTAQQAARASAGAAGSAASVAAEAVRNIAGAGLNPTHLAAAVKDSAQQIWLAGMGAFAKAQQEGGKAFESLIHEGLNLQKKTQGMAEEKISEVTGRMTAMADTVSAKAGQNWDKLEALFEQRTAKAMSKLGVPTAKDVQSLSDRVDELAAAVARLAASGPNGKSVARTGAKSTAKSPTKSATKSATKAAPQAAAKPASKAASKTAAPAKKAPRKAPARKTVF